VAGRMARFSGVKQGIAVWIWTIVMTALAAILIAVTEAKFDIPDGLPQLPTEDGTLKVDRAGHDVGTDDDS
jgi:hypothetical protein